MQKINFKQSPLAWFCAVLFAMSVFSPQAQALPRGGAYVYIVYTMKNKKVKKTLKSAIPSSIKAKFYNADLLTVADYSGKQKAVSKFERAQLVVFIGDETIKLLEGSELKIPVLIVNSGLQDVTSRKVVTYLFDTAHASAAPSGLPKTSLASAAELKPGTVGEKDAVVIIGQKDDAFWKEVAAVVEKLLAL